MLVEISSGSKRCEKSETYMEKESRPGAKKEMSKARMNILWKLEDKVIDDGGRCEH